MPFNLMPGEDDWLKRIMGGPFGGMGTPPFFPGQATETPGVPMPTPSAAPPERPGFLGKLDKATQQFGGTMPLGLALLANSGSGAGFGEIFGRSALQAQQMGRQSANDQLRDEYMRAQIEAMKRKPAGNTPSSVAEYEYAKQNGFQGSFQDWIAAGGQSSRPSAITTFEYWKSLPKEQQQQMLETMRAPTVKEIGGVPTIITGTGGVNPLSTLDAESDAKRRLKEAEATGAAFGKASGEIAGGILKKGSDAKGVQRLLEDADALIDVATGSTVGAVRDRVAKTFGYAPSSAQAIAELQILQSNLMLQQPRMEGPQSNMDQQLYREMAGQIGDPTVPADLKKVALRRIRKLQEKYVERAEGAPAPGAAPTTPKRVRVDAQGNVIGN